MCDRQTINIYNNTTSVENGPMASSRINVDIAGQVLDPADPDPSYINFTILPQGLYDYDNNDGAYSLTSPTEITINRTGYYNVGLLTNIQSATSAAPIFQIHNLVQGVIGTVPPICSVYCQTNLVSFIPGYLCTQSGDANAELAAGSIIKVAYITNVQCNVLPTSCLSITLLDGVIGPSGSGGSPSAVNIGVGVDVYKAATNPLEFRRLNAISGLSVVQNGNQIDFTNTLPGRDVTNLGIGEQLITTISPTEYGCKSLTAGSGIGIVSDATSVQFAVTQVAVNSIATTGTGDLSLIQSGTPPIPIIKELIAGSNITLTTVGNDISIASTGGSAPDYLDDSCNLGLSSLYDIQTTPTVVIFPNLLIPGGFNGLRYVTATGIFTVVNTGIYNISFCLAHYRNGSNQTGSVNFYVTLNNDDNLRLVSARNYGTIVYADVNYANASANVRLEAGNTVRLIAVKSAAIATTYIDNDHSNFSITRLF